MQHTYLVICSPLLRAIDYSDNRGGTDVYQPANTYAASSAADQIPLLVVSREQATLHFIPAFWGLLLPITVTERVSDIWRSYFTQALLPGTGAVTTFAAPWVTRVGTLNGWVWVRGWLCCYTG